MKCTPNIRFKGFEGEWNSYNFGKCFTFLKNNTLSRAELTCIGGSIQNIHYGDVLVKFGSVLNVATESLPYVADESRVQKNNNVLLKNGDIIIADTAEDTTVGKCSEVQGIDGNNVVSGLHTMPVRPLENFAAGYLGYFMNAPAYHDSIIPLIQGTKVSSISRSTITNSRLSSPSSIDEQQQIASFFDSLDTLISKREKEVEKMRNIKRALLEKMFPQGNEKVPQIRFGEFKEEYEECLAKDMFETFVEKNHPELPVLSATQDRGMVIREEIGYNISHDKRNEIGYKRVLPGQFVIHLRSFQGGFAHSAVEGITSPAYDIFGFKDIQRHDDYYWKYIFSSKSFIKRLETVTYGIRDGRNISYPEFLGLKFMCPQKQEQTKIANLFASLDRAISARERQVTLLKNMKLALLEQMFVNN